MNSLVCIKPERIEYENQPQPRFQAGGVVVKIRRIGICGTDLHAFEGTQPYFEYPRILGHELSGEVAESAPGSAFKMGDAVTIMPYFYCGQCYACKQGKTNCCVNLQVAGVHVDGGMREYFEVPESSLLPGRGLSHDELALTEPLAIGAHGVSRARIVPGDHVLVIGAGPIGIALTMFLKVAGARVIVVDVNNFRLNFCKEQLNADHIINAQQDDVMEQLREITSGNMAPVVVDATGNVAAINNAFRYMSHGGQYVLVGLQKEDIVFSHPEFHKREGTLMSSRNATKKDFEYVMESVLSKKITPLNMITHRVAFGEVKQEISSWLNPANHVIKAMVEI